MLVTMSDKELNRVNVIQAVVEKRLRRRDAAAQLKLTERQVQRLINRFRDSGVSGLTVLTMTGLTESDNELDDIFAWQEQRTLSKSLTFRYDKMIYLIEPTEENSRIAGEKIKVYDYPDGTMAFKYGYRSLRYQVFDKLDCIDQGQIVDN